MEITFSQGMVEDYRNDPDVTLMMSVTEGNRQAFEELVLKYQKSVINTAYRYTGNPSVAEELAQDVFVRVFRAAHTYRPEARFSTWLFTIVRNICSNYRTREGRYDQQLDSDIDPGPSFSARENPEETVLRKELQTRIQQALQSLPETLRMPLILHQFNQMSYEEVAKVLEISLAAVKVRIHRARLALAELLKDYL